MDKVQYYEDRKVHYANRSGELEKKYNRYSLIRLISFFAGAGLAVLVFSVNTWLGLGFVALFLVGFGRFVLWHQNIQAQSKRAARMSRINDMEVDRLRGKVDAFDPGQEFIDPDHPYSVDLDIFGTFSIFQHITCTSTSVGRQRLAEMLSLPVNAAQAVERQHAIKELAEKVDWRQNFQATGLETPDQVKDVKNLIDWLDDEYIMLHAPGLKAALYWVPVVMIAALLCPVAYLPWSAKGLFILLPAFFFRKTLQPINALHEKTGKAEEVLKNYTRLIQHLEEKSFDSAEMARIKSLIQLDGKPASSRLKRLSFIINQLNARYNVFAIVLNLLFLWDMRYVLALEKWKAEQREHLPKWFQALAETDALNSLGNLSFNHPTWAFPKFLPAGQEVLIAEGLGHPMLLDGKRVDNDISIPHKGHLKLITGSNMAGKSTFLRSVGLGIVMAMIGAPVCARKLELIELQVYSSMRTTDDLHENTSSFYAELKRLKFILDAVKAGPPAFLLLDEILKGTNSLDRHTGAKALILQLIRLNGNGLVATHDLELGSLEAEHTDKIENQRFEVQVEGDELTFDYKIQPGVAQSLNATILMRRMGIDL